MVRAESGRGFFFLHVWKRVTLNISAPSYKDSLRFQIALFFVSAHMGSIKNTRWCSSSSRTTTISTEEGHLTNPSYIPLNSVLILTLIVVLRKRNSRKAEYIQHPLGMFRSIVINCDQLWCSSVTCRAVIWLLTFSSGLRVMKPALSCV